MMFPLWTAMGHLVRRGLIVALAAVIASTAGLGQNRARQANIGYISPGIYGISNDEYLGGVRKGLSDRGYVEGRNLVIEERYADGFTDRLPSLISGLLAKKVDLLMTLGSQTAIVAQHLTSSVPIVFLSGDPIKAGLVPSLSHPSANLTGFSLASTEYSVKWPELLKEVAPNLHRVALVWNPTNPVVAEEVNQIRHIAPKLGLEIQTLALLPPNIDGTLAAISAAGVDGLILANDAVVESFASRLIPFAAERQLPAIWGVRVRSDAGCANVVFKRLFCPRAAGRPLRRSYLEGHFPFRPTDRANDGLYPPHQPEDGQSAWPHRAV